MSSGLVRKAILALALLAAAGLVACETPRPWHHDGGAHSTPPPPPPPPGA